MGIDLGSTGLKAVIYDLAGNAVASGSSPTKKYNPNPDHPEWTVWQPEQIWGGTAEAIKTAVAQLADPNSLKAVAVTGMGMDAVSSRSPWIPLGRENAEQSNVRAIAWRRGDVLKIFLQIRVTRRGSLA